MIIFHGNDWFHLSLAVSVLLKFQRNFYLKNVRHLVLLWVFYTIQHFPLAQTLQITSVLLCVRQKRNLICIYFQSDGLFQLNLL